MRDHTDLSFTVPWVPFRRALCAVLPCADAKGVTPDACRVQLQGRRAGRVLVSATDRYVIGCVSIDTLVPPREDYRVDLPLDSVRKVLAVFPEMPDSDDYTLHVLVTEEQIEIKDVSGMIDGEILTVTRLPESDDVASIPRMLSRQIRGGELHGEVAHTALSMDRFRRFQAATKCYGSAPLVLSWGSGRRSAVVRIGTSFLGMISVSSDDDALETTVPLDEFWDDLALELEVPVEVDPVDLDVWSNQPSEEAADA